MTENLKNQEDRSDDDVIDEIVDLDSYARAGKKPPKARAYRIRVNNEPFVFDEPKPTGREILIKAGLVPPENYTLRVKMAGQKPRKVELDERVDLRQPGIEKFKALPRDQTEG